MGNEIISKSQWVVTRTFQGCCNYKRRLFITYDMAIRYNPKPHPLPDLIAPFMRQVQPQLLLLVDMMFLPK